jgi:hypothetical protein
LPAECRKESCKDRLRMWGVPERAYVASSRYFAMMDLILQL